MAQRARLRRWASWAAVGVIGIAALAAGGNAGAGSLLDLRPAGGGKARPVAAAQDTSSNATVAAHGTQAERVQTVHLAAAVAPLPTGPRPVLDEGVTMLKGGIEAVRHGDTVVVSFDLPDVRTRRADRFDQLLRTTLPAIYGAAVDTLLPSRPKRLVTDPAALVSELPRSGLAVASGDGWRLVVWPETRPGRDGPLVVRYRTALAH